MSNPGNAVTQEEQDKDTKKSTPTFAERVNDVVKGMSTDDEGNFIFPDDVEDEALKHAAMAEKRYRDTQAALTRTSQENKTLKAEKSVLLSEAANTVALELTDEQAEELDELKFSDPEAWRKKMNTYEREAREKHEADLQEKVKKVSSDTLAKDEIERRKEVLSNFMKANEGFELNDDIISNDIPPRITKKLETGDISFEDFLSECKAYLETGKTFKKDDPNIGPNMNKIGGNSMPDEKAVKEDVVSSYQKESY